jgi:mRNA interferase MazF
MRRGEVWWANLPKPLGMRPVLLVSRDVAIRLREAVTVAQITTRIRDIPTEIPLGPQNGLKKKCVINCDVLTTIPKVLLVEPVATLSPEKMAVLNRALGFALDIIHHY